MKQTDEASTDDAASTCPSHDYSELPPRLSADQQCFNESLRVGVRTMGEILRNRRRKDARADA